ncbi:hypothetical protein [Microbulbifer sp. TRSA005]
MNAQSTDTTATTITIADPVTIQVSPLNSITGPGPAAQISV